MGTCNSRNLRAILFSKNTPATQTEFAILLYDSPSNVPAHVVGSSLRSGKKSAFIMLLALHTFAQRLHSLHLTCRNVLPPYDRARQETTCPYKVPELNDTDYCILFPRQFC
jgi:hypothetical protein